MTTSKINDGAITNAKLATTAGEAGGEWLAWVPTWTNFTLGNGTQIAVYTQIGKTIIARLRIVLGSTSVVGSNPKFTPPVAPNSTTYLASQSSSIGHLWVEDAGTANYQGVVAFSGSLSVVTPFLTNTTGTYEAVGGISATVPMTWTTGDYMNIQFVYEAD